MFAVIVEGSDYQQNKFHFLSVFLTALLKVVICYYVTQLFVLLMLPKTKSILKTKKFIDSTSRWFLIFCERCVDVL